MKKVHQKANNSHMGERENGNLEAQIFDIWCVSMNIRKKWEKKRKNKNSFIFLTVCDYLP